MQLQTSQTKTKLKWAYATFTSALVLTAVVSGLILNRNTPDEALLGSIDSVFSDEINFGTGGGSEYSIEPRLALELTDEGYSPTRTLESKILDTQEYMAVGAQWDADLPDGTSVLIDLRTAKDGTWQQWQTLRISDDVAHQDNPDLRVSDLLFVDRANQAQLRFNLATHNPQVTPTLNSIELSFIDTSDGPIINESAIAAHSVTSGKPPIISRSQWGANESWMNWGPAYKTPEQFIVHHTAGGTGASDPAATVRGIYYYHAVSLDWGDIGYNFLIDTYGNIYEGRAGGDSVIGGHTLGHNDGSIGIALLGTYESSPATAAAESALAQLVGYLSVKHDLQPTQFKTFKGKSAYTLAGHRDFTSTLCPGSNEHSRLSGLRSSASAAMSNYQAGSVTGSVTQITGAVLQPGVAKYATIKVKNTGAVSWNKTGAGATTIITESPYAHNSSLYTGGWISRTRAAVMQESIVNPGQLATFKVRLYSTKLGNVSDRFAVFRHGLDKISGTDFVLTRSTREDYAGKIVSGSGPHYVSGGSTATIELKVKNTGARSWTQTGNHFAALNLTNPKGRSSQFRAPNWPLPYRPTNMDSAHVPPDAIATFRFDVRVPSKQGTFKEFMQPVIEGVTFIPGAETAVTFVVQNANQAELQDRPITIYSIPNGKQTVNVTLVNRSNYSWTKTGAKAVSLQTAEGNSGSSIFSSSAWISNTIPAEIPNTVGVNQKVRISFPVTAPGSLGTYTESFQLVAGNSKPIDGSKFEIKVIVKNGYDSKIVRQAPVVNLKSGESKRVTVKIQNLGSREWFSNGSKIVQVLTDQTLKHASSFATGTWQNSYSPTILEPSKVSFNQFANLSIEVKAGAAGTTDTEHFVLMDYASRIIPGSQFAIKRVTSGSTSNVGSNGPNLRVGIYSASSIAVTGSKGISVRDSSGKKLGETNGSVTVGWDGLKYKVTGNVTASSSRPIWVVPLSGSILELSNYEDHPAWNPSLNDNQFRGYFEIRRSSADSKLHAINILPIEYYMRGLGEASTDPNQNYLQSLAIAARTYAEYQRSIGGKHPEHGYDLNNTTDQVYKGYGLEKRNADWVNAVKASRSKMILYKSQVVVTPYFSQSDGRTRSFAEAFGGPEKPWLVSVSVPENSGKTLQGHGVGMDASAARIRASNGQSVDNILKSFYTGIVVRSQY